MKKIYILGLLITALFQSGCSNDTQVKAWNMIKQGALLVDVRTPGEFKSGHLPGARLIPLDTISSKISAFGSDKSRPIVVYCKSGSRSSRAESILKAAGFTNVLNGGGYNSLMSVKGKLDSGEIKPASDS
ncbi:MAG: rhodanese-like domain-containing protein [Gammaproteobacteria bacterium]|nr:rhodanese-like domain-containing protein [Gammaproteobacteria bacterium]